MWMNGSILKSDRPASRTSTEVFGSALSRLAMADPADPPPTMTMSYLSALIRTPPRRVIHQAVRSRCAAGARRAGLAGAGEPLGGGGRKIAPDVFGLAILRQTVVSELASEPRLLVAAPLCLGDVWVVVVDPHCSSSQPG